MSRLCLVLWRKLDTKKKADRRKNYIFCRKIKFHLVEKEKKKRVILKSK